MNRGRLVINPVGTKPLWPLDSLYWDTFLYKREIGSQVVKLIVMSNRVIKSVTLVGKDYEGSL